MFSILHTAATSKSMPWFVSVCHACFSVLSRDQSSHLLSAFPVPSRTHSLLPCQYVFHFLEYCSSIHFHFHPCLLAQIRAYAKPSRQVQLAPLASLKIPGLLLCMVRFNRVQCKSALILCSRFFCACIFPGAFIPVESRQCCNVLAAIYQLER